MIKVILEVKFIFLDNDRAQNYLIFQPMNKHFKKICNIGHISEWKSNSLSDEVIKPPTTSDSSLTSALNYVGNKIRLKFDGGYLKQYKITFTHGKIVNVYVFCALSSNLNNFDPTLESCLLGTVKLNKMLLSVRTNFLDMVLDLIHVEHFYFLVVNSLKT